MLWPIRWTRSPGKTDSICSPSRRDRRLMPAIGGTRDTITRLPAARNCSGMRLKYDDRVNRPRPIRSKPKSPCAKTIGAASRIWIKVSHSEETPAPSQDSVRLY